MLKRLLLSSTAVLLFVTTALAQNSNNGTPGPGTLPSSSSPYAAIGNGATTGASPASRSGELYDFKGDALAAGDTLLYPDGTIAASGTAFSSASATFTSADCHSGANCRGPTDKTIYIDGAGAAGAPLTTTIVNFIDAHDVTLGAAASTTVPSYALAQALVSVDQSGGGSYAPADTIALGNSISINVGTTHVKSVAINAVGSGGATGACTLTGTSGTALAGARFQASATVSGGILSAITATPTIAGRYTAALNSNVSEPVTSNCGLIGATLTVVMGTDSLFIGTNGNSSTNPSTINQVSTSGSGTGAVVGTAWNLLGSFKYGTLDTAALSAAVSSVQTAQAAGKNLCLHVPAGRYLISSPPPVVSGVPLCVYGDGKELSVFDLTPTFSGTLFETSDSWIGSSFPYNANQMAQRDQSGTRFSYFSVTGNRAAPAQQNAFVLADQTDHLDFDHIFVSYLNGYCALFGGATSVETQAFIRESHISDVRCYYDGGFNNAGPPNPVFEFSSIGSPSSITDNELGIDNINVYAPYGPGVVMREGGLIRGNTIRVEGEESGSIDPVADLFQVGDAGATAVMARAQFFNLELVNPYLGSSAVHLLSSSGALKPFDIVLQGHISASGNLGKGINISSGRSSSFDFSNVPTIDYGLTIASTSTTGGNLTFNFHGNENSITQNLDATVVAGGTALVPLRVAFPTLGGPSFCTIGQGCTGSTTAKGATSNLSTTYVLCQGTTTTSVTGTASETVLMPQVCIIPAGLLGTNGELRFSFAGTATANVDTKTYRVRLGTNPSGLGASNIFQQAYSTTTNPGAAGIGEQILIANRNSASAQIVSPSLIGPTVAPAAFSVNTAPQLYLSVTGQLGTTTDTMTIDSYLVELVQSVGN